MGEEVWVVRSSRSNHLHSREHRRPLVKSLWSLTKTQKLNSNHCKIRYKINHKRGDISSYRDKLFPRLLKVPGVTFRFSCIKTQRNVPTWVFTCTNRYARRNWVLMPLLWYTLIIVYAQIPDVYSHNSHPRPMFFFTFPFRKYWKCKDMIMTGYAHIHSAHPLVPICHKSLCLGCYWLPSATF